MKKVLPFLLVVLVAAHAIAQESVADAARASKQKQTTAKKVITDEDMPSTSGGSVANGAAMPSGGSGDWSADLAHLRSVYRDLCADPALRTAKTLPPEKQKLVEDAMAPLKVRMERDKQELTAIKARQEQLKREEDAEVAAAGPDRQKVTEIHERYQEERKADQAKVAESLKLAGELFKEMMSVASECMQTASR